MLAKIPARHVHSHTWSCNFKLGPPKISSGGGTSFIIQLKKTDTFPAQFSYPHCTTLGAKKSKARVCCRGEVKEYPKVCSVHGFRSRATVSSAPAPLSSRFRAAVAPAPLSSRSRAAVFSPGLFLRAYTSEPLSSNSPLYTEEVGGGRKIYSRRAPATLIGYIGELYTVKFCARKLIVRIRAILLARTIVVCA